MNIWIWIKRALLQLLTFHIPHKMSALYRNETNSEQQKKNSKQQKKIIKIVVNMNISLVLRWNI